MLDDNYSDISNNTQINNYDKNENNHFCVECNNLLYPTTRDNKLVYICKANCNFILAIDDNDYNSKLVSKKEFLLEKNVLIDREFALDPTMPRSQKPCLQCEHPESVYLITTDIDNTRIELLYICGDTNCGYNWREKQLE